MVFLGFREARSTIASGPDLACLRRRPQSVCREGRRPQSQKPLYKPRNGRSAEIAADGATRGPHPLPRLYPQAWINKRFRNSCPRKYTRRSPPLPYMWASTVPPSPSAASPTPGPAPRRPAPGSSTVFWTSSLPSQLRFRFGSGTYDSCPSAECLQRRIAVVALVRRHLRGLLALRRLRRRQRLAQAACPPAPLPAPSPSRAPDPRRAPLCAPCGPAVLHLWRPGPSSIPSPCSTATCPASPGRTRSSPPPSRSARPPPPPAALRTPGSSPPCPCAAASPAPRSRGRVHRHRLTSRQARLAQPPQHPPEHLLVRLHRNAGARAVWRGLLQRVGEAPQTQAVAGVQRDAALRIEAQEPEQQQEVHPRGATGVRACRRTSSGTGARRSRRSRPGRALRSAFRRTAAWALRADPPPSGTAPSAQACGYPSPSADSIVFSS